MKVLLATDGTKYADAAADMVGKLGLGADDEVHVVSAVDMAVPLAVDIYGGYLPDTTELEKAGRENAKKIVDGTVEKLNKLFGGNGPSISQDVLFGSPESRIVETAEELKADIIVLGSHGYKTWERVLLGSVSSSVVHHAPCSVLVVRTDA